MRADLEIEVVSLAPSDRLWKWSGNTGVEAENRGQIRVGQRKSVSMALIHVVIERKVRPHWTIKIWLALSRTVSFHQSWWLSHQAASCQVNLPFTIFMLRWVNHDNGCEGVIVQRMKSLWSTEHAVQIAPLTSLSYLVNRFILDALRCFIPTQRGVDSRLHLSIDRACAGKLPLCLTYRSYHVQPPKHSHLLEDLASKIC